MLLTLFFALFFSSFCSASVTKPLSLEFQSGYLEEKIRLSLQLSSTGSPTIYEERYDDLSFYVNEIRLEGVKRGFYYFLRSSFAAIGKGHLQQKADFLQKNFPKSLFSFGTHSSFITNNFFQFGYLFNLTPNRQSSWIFGPFLGGNYLLEKIQTSPEKSSDQSTDISSILSKKFQLERWGIFLGPILQFEPQDSFVFKLLYGYGFLSSKQKILSKFFNENANLELTNFAKVRLNGAHAQIGEIEASWLIKETVKLGFVGNISYFFTGFREAQNEETLFFSQTNNVTYSLRQTS